MVGSERSKLRTERAVSAGGVVYRLSDRGPEVVLCGRDIGAIWGLPKGTPEPGESIQETALREVREETGLPVTLEDPIGDITYWFARPDEGVRFHKTVHYFLMRADGFDTSGHDHEYDRVEWHAGDAAVKRASYANEQQIVRKALEMLEKRVGAAR